MSKYPKLDNEGPAKSAHPDYQKNLQSAEKFIARMGKKIPNGMQIAIKDSENLNKSLLTFSYRPAENSKEVRHADSICLHDSYSNVRSQVTRAYTIYTRTIAKPPLNALESIIAENMTGDSPK